MFPRWKPPSRWVPGTSLSSIWVKDREIVVDRFGQLCDLADSLGLTVNLEFVSTTNWSTLAGARDVLKAAHRDNAGIMVDTMHFHRARTSLDELDRLPAQWFNYVHIADDRTDVPTTLEEARRTMREERLYPGEGAVDIAGILRHLPDGVVCAIELPHRVRQRELGAARFARECLDRTKRYLSAGLCGRHAVSRGDDDGLGPAAPIDPDLFPCHEPPMERAQLR